MKKQIGRTIKNIRKSHSFTQEQFAKKVLKKSVRQLKRIESGEGNLTLVDFLKVVDYFSFEESFLFDFIRDEGRSEVVTINKIYDMINNFQIPLEEVEDAVKLFVALNSPLSHYEIKTIDMIDSFITYKKIQDENVLYYFYKNNLEFFKENNRAVSLLLPILKPKEIIEIVEQQKIRNSNRVIDNKLQLLLNAVGLLLEKNYMNKSIYNKYFSEIDNMIFKNSKFEYLPMYYRHQAFFYYETREIELYQMYKKLSLDTARVYRKDEFLKYVNIDYEKIESAK